jgi:hypothetical protein
MLAQALLLASFVGPAQAADWHPTGAASIDTPATPGRFLAEVIWGLSEAMGETVQVSISGNGYDALMHDISERLPPHAVDWRPAFDEIGARAYAQSALGQGAQCSAVIRRVPQGWEYTTWGECPAAYARPEVAAEVPDFSTTYSRPTLAQRRLEKLPARSTWVAFTAHLDPTFGQVCTTRTVENPDPPPVTLQQESCVDAPVAFRAFAGGMEVASVKKRDDDARLTRDLRLEIGSLMYLGVPMIAPSLGFRFWLGRDWLYTGARARFLFTDPGAAASLGLALGGDESAFNLELSAEHNRAYEAPAMTVSFGGAFGER